MPLAEGVAKAESTRSSPTPLASPFTSRRREFWPGGPWVTAVGFGSYRVGKHPSLGHPECEDALRLALDKGLNLIDTSSNYGGGLSEILIGQVLREYFEAGKLSRDQIVLVTKGGYIQGTTMEKIKAREFTGNPFKNIVKFGEQVWHCMHPEFLRDQVSVSASRLGVSAIDVYLIHNPEYMLKRAQLDSVPVEEAREIFYARLEDSFRCLEELVAEGKIAAYGISSNTLGAPEEEYTCVSLRRCFEIAESISPNHHFRVTQMPLNWIEVAAAFLEIGGKTTLALASEKKMGVLVNRPLNAMYDDHLMRLARPQVSPEERKNLDEGSKKGLENWEKLSSDLEDVARKHIDIPGYEDAPLQQMVLSTLAQFPGVSSVLTGMRKPSYVEDAEEAMRRPKILRSRETLASIFQNLEFHRD